MQWWKVVGAAAFVGVAATGVLVARAERRHHDYTPEEIHERLRARAAEALEGEALRDEAPAPGDVAEVLASETPTSELPVGEVRSGEARSDEARSDEAQSGEAQPGSVEAEAGTPPSEPGAPPTDVRRRLVTQVNRVRTRLGLRRRPTPRRKARAAQA